MQMVIITIIAETIIKTPATEAATAAGTITDSEDESPLATR